MSTTLLRCDWSSWSYWMSCRPSYSSSYFTGQRWMLASARGPSNRFSRGGAPRMELQPCGAKQRHEFWKQGAMSRSERGGGQRWSKAARATGAEAAAGGGGGGDEREEGGELSEAAGKAESEEGKEEMGALQLATYFGMWYVYNIIFNIYNKKALNVFPFPWLMATLQLVAGALWMGALWGLKLQPCPPVTKEFLLALAAPAFFHTVGHISACVSFSKVAVSFTHVIKAAEPVFSVAVSSLLGETYPAAVWLSIVPIVAGCALAAVTEVTFNATGLWGAMISNLGFVLRNILSKRSLRDFSQFDGMNLYGWITILSLAYLLPVSIAVEGPRWAAGYRHAVATVHAPSFHTWVLLSGIFYHLYNQASYQALDGISPLTFSVGNTMKRVVVIIATVLVFRNPILPLNALGSAIAILGTFLYSQASQMKKDQKKQTV